MNFILKPFGHQIDEVPKVSGTLELDCSELTLKLRIEDHKQQIAWSEKDLGEVQNRRGSNLWKENCFEIFLARRGAEIYHEFNFAPNGAWDAFSFRSYRQARTDYVSEGLSFDSSTRLLRNDEGRPETVEIRIKALHGTRLQFLFNKKELDFQVATVLNLKSGEQLLYAILQNESQADFHKRELFREFQSSF